MNLTEINRINMLLSWLLNIPLPDGRICTSMQAMGAAEALAYDSYQRVGVGINGDDVEQNWPNTRLPARRAS